MKIYLKYSFYYHFLFIHRVNKITLRLTKAIISKYFISIVAFNSFCQLPSKLLPTVQMHCPLLYERNFTFIVEQIVDDNQLLIEVCQYERLLDQAFCHSLVIQN